MVVARWRRLTRVAWWIGHAPHVTIGVVKARASHCHPIAMNHGDHRDRDDRDGEERGHDDPVAQ